MPKLATAVARNHKFGWEWVVYEYTSKDKLSLKVLAAGWSLTYKGAWRRASSDYQKHLQIGKYEENTKQVN